MWKCEPNQPVPPQVALVMEFDHSNSNTNWTGFSVSGISCQGGCCQNAGGYYNGRGVPGPDP